MGRRVHSGLRGFTQALLSVVWFIRFRVGLLGHTMESSDSFGFSWIHSCVPRGLRVHWVWREYIHSGSRCGRRVYWLSRGFTCSRLWIDGIIGVLVGSLGRAYVSSGLFGFTQAHIRLVVFICLRVGSLHPPRGRRAYTSLREFNRSHPVVVVFIPVRIGSLRRA